MPVFLDINPQKRLFCKQLTWILWYFYWIYDTSMILLCKINRKVSFLQTIIYQSHTSVLAQIMRLWDFFREKTFMCAKERKKEERKRWWYKKKAAMATTPLLLILYFTEQSWSGYAKNELAHPNWYQAIQTCQSGL